MQPATERKENLSYDDSNSRPAEGNRAAGGKETNRPEADEALLGEYFVCAKASINRKHRLWFEPTALTTDDTRGYDPETDLIASPPHCVCLSADNRRAASSFVEG